MKMILSIVALLAFVTSSTSLSAQEVVIFASPVGGGQQGGVNVQPQTTAPQPAVWPQQVYPTPTVVPQPQVVNPIVQQTRPTRRVLGHDLYGNPITETNLRTIHESATRPGAGIPAGQVRNVDRWENGNGYSCLLYTSPSPRDKRQSRMPSSA